MSVAASSLCVINRLVPNAMEARAALAGYEPATEGFTLYTSTQLSGPARGPDRHTLDAAYGGRLDGGALRALRLPVSGH